MSNAAEQGQAHPAGGGVADQGQSCYAMRRCGIPRRGEGRWLGVWRWAGQRATDGAAAASRRRAAGAAPLVGP